MRSDKQFRLLWLDPSPNGSYIYWLDGKPAIPARIQLSELEGAIQQGWIIQEQDPFKLQTEPNEIMLQKRDEIWAKMKEALLDEPGIYNKKIRSEHLRRIERRKGKDQCKQGDGGDKGRYNRPVT